MFLFIILMSFICNIEAYQRFPGTRHTSNKANGFFMLLLTLLNNVIYYLCSETKIVSSGITT